MTRKTAQLTLALTGVLATLITTILTVQSASAEGGARRDIVRQEQFVTEAFKHATEAVDFGKQGDVGKLVTHAETSLQQAMRGGRDPHLAEAMINLKEAIEHGRAGHADQATRHAEGAVTHLSQVR